MKRTACRNGGKGREKGEREGGEGGRALDPVRPFPPLLLFFRGHDFRGDYRTLGQVRSALSSTPFVALTATAPPRVRDDIAASLGLRLGAGDAGRHVLSFERPNLHLAVCKRPPGAPRDHLAALVEQHRALGRLDPTIVYTISRSDAERVRDDLAAAGLRDSVAVYHAGAADKGAVHERFLRDEVTVVVATVAFGMGIDKPNVRGGREGRWRAGGERSASASDLPHPSISFPQIRNVYHYGVPATLEGYYQQVGRAGRDGLPSRCTLLWADADWSKVASVKDPASLSAAGRAAFEAGKKVMQSFCLTSACRHAALAAHFEDAGARASGGARSSSPRCAGGCDNCDRAARGEARTADFGEDARLLVAAVAALGGAYGLGKPVAVLRGSKARDVQPWMIEKSIPYSPAGDRLHGAGVHRSPEWWKALAGALQHAGLLAESTRALGGGGGGGRGGGGRAYSAITATPAGIAFLARGGPLVLDVSADLDAEEGRAAKAAATSAAAAATATTSSSPEGAEEARLFDELKSVRSRIAAATGLVPTNVAGDALLLALAQARPATVPDLAACEGASDAFRAAHGAAFVEAVVSFCGASPVLDAGIDWAATAARRADAAAASGCNDADVRAKLVGLAGEAKGAAAGAHARFAAGETVAAIAADGGRGNKPIKPSTVVSYIAAAGAAGAGTEWARLAAEAGLTAAGARAVVAAATNLKAVNRHSAMDVVRTVERAGVAGVDYGCVSLAAALKLVGGLWFEGDAAPPAASPAARQENVRPPPPGKADDADGRPLPLAPVFQRAAKKLKSEDGGAAPVPPPPSLPTPASVAIALAGGPASAAKLAADLGCGDSDEGR